MTSFALKFHTEWSSGEESILVKSVYIAIINTVQSTVRRQHGFTQDMTNIISGKCQMQSLDFWSKVLKKMLRKLMWLNAGRCFIVHVQKLTRLNSLTKWTFSQYILYQPPPPSPPKSQTSSYSHTVLLFTFNKPLPSCTSEEETALLYRWNNFWRDRRFEG